MPAVEALSFPPLASVLLSTPASSSSSPFAAMKIKIICEQYCTGNKDLVIRSTEELSGHWSSSRDSVGSIRLTPNEREQQCGLRVCVGCLRMFCQFYPILITTGGLCHVMLKICRRSCVPPHSTRSPTHTGEEHVITVMMARTNPGPRSRRNTGPFLGWVKNKNLTMRNVFAKNGGKVLEIMKFQHKNKNTRKNKSHSTRLFECHRAINKNIYSPPSSGLEDVIARYPPRAVRCPFFLKIKNVKPSQTQINALCGFHLITCGFQTGAGLGVPGRSVGPAEAGGAVLGTPGARRRGWNTDALLFFLAMCSDLGSGPAVRPSHVRKCKLFTTGHLVTFQWGGPDRGRIQWGDCDGWLDRKDGVTRYVMGNIRVPYGGEAFPLIHAWTGTINGKPRQWTVSRVFFPDVAMRGRTLRHAEHLHTGDRTARDPTRVPYGGDAPPTSSFLCTGSAFGVRGYMAAGHAKFFASQPP